MARQGDNRSCDIPQERSYSDAVRFQDCFGMIARTAKKAAIRNSVEKQWNRTTMNGEEPLPRRGVFEPQEGSIDHHDNPHSSNRFIISRF